MSTCTRCGNDRKTLPVFTTRPGGYTGPPPFEHLQLPRAESSCGDCLTDHEIRILLSPVVEFCLGSLLAENYNFSRVAAALETARTFFAVRNNEPDDNRRAAMRAIGLGND